MKLNNIYLVTSIVLITIGLQSYAQEYSITSDSNQVNILFENLSKESLKTHLKYLASDELK
ncbi:hypothetical protein [Flammeovirga sp. SJP92]|uniref:hypothetical protein n=1 Tax=Flammeovirga sp. SJP92 TaxID=1775430 RepID=UPI000789A8C4|nr:hypothetical protein [Flammeovirga sp. SJP92]KXX69639.1 hypothetical protein AVL50_15370 [Flammeovirga sp. SJP92]